MQLYVTYTYSLKLHCPHSTSISCVWSGAAGITVSVNNCGAKDLSVYNCTKVQIKSLFDYSTYLLNVSIYATLVLQFINSICTSLIGEGIAIVAILLTLYQIPVGSPVC